METSETSGSLDSKITSKPGALENDEKNIENDPLKKPEDYDLSKAFEDIFKTMDKPTVSSNGKNQKIEEIILAELKEHKSKIHEVKSAIEKHFKQQLSYIDEAYIEKKYLNDCIKLWLEGLSQTIKAETNKQTNNTNILTEVGYSLNNIQHLADIPVVLKRAVFFEILIFNCKITTEVEQLMVSQYKDVCIKEIFTYSRSIKTELLFLKSFETFLINSKNIRQVFVELSLVNFKNGSLSFKDLIGKILTSSKIKDENLKESAKNLLDNKNISVIEKEMKKHIDEYLKPVEIHEIRIENRLTIEVKSKNLILSEILPRVENAIKAKRTIEDIIFVAANSVQINANLKQDIWHGKNVAIFTKRIEIIGSIRWDVSGKDANVYFSNPAGRDYYGFGKNGLDGNAGESGGNVLLLAEKIDNVNNISITSHGGNGGKGQDGGSGRDGIDGKGVSRYDFDNTFNTPISTLTTNIKTVDKLFQNIENESSNIIVRWKRNAHRYIEANTSQGNKIYFSLYMTNNLFTEIQGFFLYKGSSGEAGKRGGEFGLGGNGGYSGEIQIQNTLTNQKYPVKVFSKAGAVGKNGQGGLYGKHGTQGWDMGWIDSEYWKRTVHFGTNRNSKLNLAYFRDSASDRIWCPYEYYSTGSSYVWVTLRESRLENQYIQSYRERYNFKQNYNRKYNALATRKKSLSKQSITNKYSHFIFHDNIATKNINSKIETLTHFAAEAISKKQHENRPAKYKAKIHSLHIFDIENEYESLNTESPSVTAIKEIQNMNFDEFTKTLKDNQIKIITWLDVGKYEFDLSQLSKLFQIFEDTQQGKLNQEMSADITQLKRLLINKYKLNILQEIDKSLPLPKIPADSYQNIAPESVVKYLKKVSVPENKFHHGVLGSLNQYVFENTPEHRVKISKYCKDELRERKDKAFRFSMQAYILETGKASEISPYIKHYYDEYTKYSEKRLVRLNTYLSLFKSELLKPRHKIAFDLWIKSECNLFDMDLEGVIKKDRFLHNIYTKLKHALTTNYNWDTCFEDEKILNFFDEYIHYTGPVSRCFRELLAYIYDVNIRIYVDNQSTLRLSDNHNRRSKQILNLLLKDNKFTELVTDEKYFELEMVRKNNNKSYKNILSSFFGLQMDSKSEIDAFVQNKSYLKATNVKFDNLFNYDIFGANETENIKKIAEYFNEDKDRIKNKLQKITFEHVRQLGIIKFILTHFESNGRHISYREMCYFINSIMFLCLKNEKPIHTFSWLIVSSSQHSWVGESLLLQLEDIFRCQLKEKSKWRCYLKKIDPDILLCFGDKISNLKPDDLVSTECVDEIFYLLSNIFTTTVNLNRLDLSEWPFALKYQYWVNKIKILVAWKEEDLTSSSYYLMSVENMFGNILAHELMKCLEDKKSQLSSSILVGILSNYHNEKWNLSGEEIETLKKHSITEWIAKMHEKFLDADKHRNVTQIAAIVKSNSNTSAGVKDNLQKIVSAVQNIGGQHYSINLKPVEQYTEEDIKTWAQEIRVQLTDKQDSSMNEQCLAVIDRAIKLTKGFNLYDTQRFSILALLENKRSILAQISTGEGKTVIVVAAAIMKVLYGQKVDIITSSSILAKRDASGNKNIYNLFNINVSHNCNENIEKRKDAYSNNMVVYGDLSSFQRDYLLDRFFGKNVLGDRTFANVIIDEVDSLLLDKGNNILYLSHDIAGLDKLESVYIFIWHWINRPVKDYEQITHSLNINAIKESILSDLHNQFKREDIGKLDSKLTNQQQSVIWERLIRTEVLDVAGNVTKPDINVTELSNLLSPEFDYLCMRLKHMLSKFTTKANNINIPNYLKPFVEDHLDSWIKSAISAFFMKSGQDYVVDVDRTGAGSDRNANIIILDRDTGTDQYNSQWDEALHQFLQLKHGCKITMQSLKAVFISNVSYFKLYRNLYGLTGTLGSQRERELLKQIHNVDFVTVPTTKPKKFQEINPIICVKKNDWLNTIYENAVKLTKERSVLIICQTINDVEALNKYFNQKGLTRVFMYTRDYEAFDIVQGEEKLGKGQIIIATNLAGRGTDIKLTNELKKAGGLHVCITYLPNNIRIEQQAFGRAARNGDTGTGQVITLNLKGKGYSNTEIFKLKKDRDTEELHRIMNVKAFYNDQISVEESCFEVFKNVYGEIEKKLVKDKVPEKVKSILLQNCLDKWAFWLDKYSEYVKKNMNNKNKRYLKQSFDLFTSDLNGMLIFEESNLNHWRNWVKLNPIKLLQVGKHLIEDGKHSDAIKLFDEVIAQEPDFCEAAHYFKAFALSKNADFEPNSTNIKSITNYNDIKKELCLAARLFNKHSQLGLNYSGLIDEIKKNYMESIININAYSEQKNIICNIYQVFLKSINDIMGHYVTAQAFANAEITEDLSELIYNDLLADNVLSRTKVRKADINDLNSIAFEYSISVQKLTDFLKQYEEREIDENVFRKELKTQIALPSLELFWKNLITQKVLNNETKYIVINVTKLKNIDPSLFDSLIKRVHNGKIQKKALSVDTGEIFLYSERIKEQASENNLVFTKNEFKSAITVSKYQKLKSQGVFSYNKKATVPDGFNNKDGKTFDSYDSITAGDFAIANINIHDTELILADLVNQKVLAKRAEVPHSYKLVVQFDKIKDIKISFCSVYDQVVQNLICLRFIYRITLQKIALQWEEDSVPLTFNLLSKPHTNLMFEFLDRDIIKSPKVTRMKSDDVKKKLAEKYSSSMTKSEILHLLTQDELLKEHSNNDLLDHLIEKHWISVHYNRTYTIKKDPTSSLDSIYDDIKTSLKLCLENRLTLSKDDTIEYIVKSLEQLRSTAKSLNVPDNQLTSLSLTEDRDKFSDVEEIYVMDLNGLDKVQKLEEKKWTVKMIFNSIIVALMGIAQIGIGVAIELFSAGLCTHFASAFINEGIGDIFFSISALTSGYFSWGDYLKHKGQSLIYTAVTFGIGAFLSKGVQLSKFGYKIFGSSLEIAGKKAAEISGKELIQIVGKNAIYKKVLQRIAVNTVEGIALGISAYGVDLLITNYLEKICQDIASMIVGNIEKQVNEHAVLDSVKEMQTIVGDKSTRDIVYNLTESFIKKQNFTEKFLPVLVEIANSVIQGVENAVNKRNKAGVPFQMRLNIKVLNVMVIWFNRVLQMENIKKGTISFLNELNDELKMKLNKLKSENLGMPANNTKKNNEFLNEITEYWKTLLRQRAGEVVKEHVVSPILNKGANKLMKVFATRVGNWYQDHQNNIFRPIFENITKMKQTYKENSQKKIKTTLEISQTEKQMIKQYHNNLLNLMKKTKSPELFAAVVRENVPMDLTCVSACPEILTKYLKLQGVELPGLTIVAQGDDGTSQFFTEGSESTNRVIVTLQLKHNRFYFSDDKVQNSEASSEHNSLYSALAHALPELEHLSPHVFRNEIADFIEASGATQYYIREVWHQPTVPIEVRTRGGRLKSDIMLDENTAIEDVYKVNDVDKHIVARFTDYIRLGGQVQRIAEKAGLPKENILEGGKSELQDKHGTRPFPAGHVLRLQLGKPIKAMKDSEYYTELKNIVGHTQIVPFYANDWHGIGGDIDKLQSDSVKKLAMMDYSKSMTLEDEYVIQNIKNDFVTKINYRIDEDTKLSPTQRAALVKARDEIINMPHTTIFNKGSEGYLGVHGKYPAPKG